MAFASSPLQVSNVPHSIVDRIVLKSSHSASKLVFSKLTYDFRIENESINDNSIDSDMKEEISYLNFDSQTGLFIHQAKQKDLKKYPLLLLNNNGNFKDGYPIKEGSKIRFGTSEFIIKKIVWRSKDEQGSDLDRSERPIVSASNCESNNRRADNSSNKSAKNSHLPSCRICHENCEDESNPLIKLCSCKGSVAFMHFLCYKHWISTKRESEDSPNSVIKLNSDDLACELCNTAIPSSFYFNSKYYSFIDAETKSSNYMIMESLGNSLLNTYYEVLFKRPGKVIYFIPFKDNDEITIGGSYSSSSCVIIDDPFFNLSSSHAQIIVSNHEIKIKDINSKHGTYVSVPPFFPLNGVNTFKYENFYITYSPYVDCWRVLLSLFSKKNKKINRSQIVDFKPYLNLDFDINFQNETIPFFKLDYLEHGSDSISKILNKKNDSTQPESYIELNLDQTNVDEFNEHKLQSKDSCMLNKNNYICKKELFDTKRLHLENSESFSMISTQHQSRNSIILGLNVHHLKAVNDCIKTLKDNNKAKHYLQPLINQHIDIDADLKSFDEQLAWSSLNLSYRDCATRDFQLQQLKEYKGNRKHKSLSFLPNVCSI